MYCPLCGKPMEDGQQYCAECTARSQETVVLSEIPPEQRPGYAPEYPQQYAEPYPQEAPQEYVSYEQPVEQTYDYYTPEYSQPQQQPRKKGLFVGLIAGAVALVAILILAFTINWNGLFLSPQERMAKAEINALEASPLYQGLAASLNGEVEAVDTAHADTQLTVTVGEEVKSALQTLLGAQLDVSWFKNIQLNMNTNINADKSSMDLALGLNGTNLATLRVIADLPAKVAYLALPELAEGTLAADFASLGLTDEQLTQISAALSGELAKQLQDLMPNPDTITKLLRKYLTLALQQLEDMEKSTKEVTVDGISQKMTVLTANISEKDAQNMLLAVLKELENDQEAKALVQDFCNFVNKISEMNGNTETISAEDVWTQIPTAITQMEGAEASTQDAISYSVYLDGKDVLCGHVLTTAEADVNFSYQKVSKGKKFASQLIVDSDGQALEIAGSGDEENAAYVVSFAGQEACTLTVSGYDKDAMAKGQLIGTFRVTLSEELTASLKDSMGSDVAALLSFATPALQVTYTKDAGEITLYMGDKMALSVQATVKGAQAAAVAIPENAIPMESADTFLSGLDLSKLTENLKTAGVPDSFFEALIPAMIG